MKRMKKLLAVVLAVAVALTMGIAGSAMAFAADDEPASGGGTTATAPTTGSVTVNPNFKGQTYTLYKIFDAQITFDDQGKQKAITYKLPSGKTLDSTGAQWFEVNNNGFVDKKATLTDDVMKSAAFKDWVKSFGAQEGQAKKAASDNDTSVKWEQIPFGYYFVDSTLGALIGVDSDNPDVVIRDKNDLPSVDKEITSAKNGAVKNDPTKTAESDQGKNEAAIAQVGDKIGYKLTVSAKPGAEKYIVTDTLSNGLTAPADTAVTVSCTSPAITASDYTVTVNGQVITVEFKQTWLNKITEAATIVIEYQATLNGNAVIGQAGNPNTVKLTWGHSSDEDVNYSEDDAKVYTAQISATKKDDKGQPLKDAGFVIQKGSKYYKLSDGVVTWVDSIDDADEHVSGTDGAVAAFTGLPNGTYTLVEKTVPKGYNKLEDKTFTIADDNFTDTNLKQTATVTNNAGTTLPSTGGIGTTIFYILGALLVIVSGIVLIARRRLSANN